MYVMNHGVENGATILRLNAGEKSKIDDFIADLRARAGTRVEMREPLHKGLDRCYTCLLAVYVVAEKEKSAG